VKERGLRNFVKVRKKSPGQGGSSGAEDGKEKIGRQGP
jgi:hypothetical protein